MSPQPRRPGRPALPPEHAALVVSALVDLVWEHGSQAAAAEVIGCSQPMISHVLTGRSAPGYALAYGIARASGMTLDRLLSREH
jgi:predicted transcriptional regulator